MRYVGLAALAAAFWILVATVRLVLYAPAPEIVPAAARVEVTAAARKPRVEEWYDPNNDVEPHPSRQENPMSRSALVRGFNEVRPRVAECYQKHRVPGTAMANVVIAKSGRVSKVDVSGKFAGTPTGACVEAAVRTARFPPSDGFSTPYPFQLE